MLNGLYGIPLQGIPQVCMARTGLYYVGFNIPLHLFCENILSKKSQEKL